MALLRQRRRRPSPFDFLRFGDDAFTFESPEQPQNTTGYLPGVKGGRRGTIRPAGAPAPAPEAAPPSRAAPRQPAPNLFPPEITLASNPTPPPMAPLMSAITNPLEALDTGLEGARSVLEDLNSDSPEEAYDRLVAGRVLNRGRQVGIVPRRRSKHTELGSALRDLLGDDRPGFEDGRVSALGDVPVIGRPRLGQLAAAGARGRLTRFPGGIATPRVAAQAKGLYGPLPGLDPGQSRVASIVLDEGLRNDASLRELLAAAETGLVESNFRNLGYGDRDSEGWRQERTSIYGTGPTGPTNVRASADRFFDEVRTDPGTSTAATPGLLAQAAQGSAFPERYDQQEGVARPILDEFLRRARVAKQLGIPLPGVGRVPGGAPNGQLAAIRKRPGPYAGSRRVVSSLLGQPVWGDKEPGHAAGGMHDPANPLGYAQDIGSVYTEGNPAEGEPPYSQDTVSGVVRRLRRRGADIPADFQLGQDWTGGVNGYDIEFLTAPHGTGPHIHLGAEWTGEAPPPGTYAGAPGGVGGQASALVAAGAPAGLVAQGIAQEYQRPAIPLTPIEAPITTEVPLPESFQDAPSSGSPESPDSGQTLLDLLATAYGTVAPATLPARRRRRRA